MNRIFIHSIALFCTHIVCTQQKVVRQPLLTPQQLVAQMGIQELSDDDQDRAVSNQQLIAEITPQLYLKSLDHIIEYIRRAPIPFAQELDLLRSLIAISISYGFTNSDITNLLFGVAQSYPAYSHQQEQLFDLLLSVPGLLYKTNPMVIAAKRGYTTALKSFNAWLLKHPELAAMQKKYIRHALFYAVQKNDPILLRAINADIKPLKYQDATFLLWYIIDTNQGVVLIPELVQLGADINFAHKGKTPLIQAVMNNNKVMVQALIASGADVNGLADFEIGSPLQQAIEQRNIDIEIILRDAGAHE